MRRWTGTKFVGDYDEGQEILLLDFEEELAIRKMYETRLPVSPDAVVASGMTDEEAGTLGFLP